MWSFLVQLLIVVVLLAFFLVSCQNVLYIVRGSVRFLLNHAHRELDKELGESQGLADDEESLSTRVVRRRVLVKVMGREQCWGVHSREQRQGWGCVCAGLRAGELCCTLKCSSSCPSRATKSSIYLGST